MTLDEFIQHETPECTGPWEMWKGQIACTRCSAHYPICDQVKEAALAENQAGYHLQRLADQGEAMKKRGAW